MTKVLTAQEGRVVPLDSRLTHIVIEYFEYSLNYATRGFQKVTKDGGGKG